jgi:hypothetical protein
VLSVSLIATRAINRLPEEDQIKTAFIIPYVVYAYTTMSFGLKNASAIYQRVI